MGKIFGWLQERIKHWTKPARLPLIPGFGYRHNRELVIGVEGGCVLAKLLRKEKPPFLNKQTSYILDFIGNNKRTFFGC